MPTVQYPNNSNSDTAFVTDDQGNRTRAVKTATIDGTIHYPTNPNSDSCYVTVDGKKQRALMTADISSEGTLEYPTNSNSTKGYVTVNGKKQRVILTASLAGGGSTPVIEELNVTPSTSAQTITAPSGTDGYSPVNVSAVTSSIDANIVAGNIKNGVSILGVEGTYTGSAPQIYRVFRDNNGVLDNSITTPFLPLPNTITNIGDYCLYNAYRNTPSSVLSGAIDLSSLTTISNSSSMQNCFYNCTGITSVNLSSLTTITGTNAMNSCFSYCTGITGTLDLSSITTINGNYCTQSMFSGCTGITGINLSGLTTISGTVPCNSMFSGCTGITSINFSALTTISAYNGCSYMFNGCTSLTTATFPLLSTLTGGTCCSQMFAGCTGLTSLSFPALTSTSFGTQVNQFYNMLQNVTSCTIHFPSNVQAKVETLTGYPNFGGTNTVVLFDLPATE